MKIISGKTIFASLVFLLIMSFVVNNFLNDDNFLNHNNFMNKKLTLSSLEDTKNLGQEIAKEILKRKDKSAFIIFLDGDLGTGKTTLVKEIIFALGIKEKVKSPTFTIIEPYELNDKNIYHIDLY